MVILERRGSTASEREHYAAAHPAEVLKEEAMDEERRPLVISWKRVAPWLLTTICVLGSVVLWFERGWRVSVATSLKENAEVHLSLDHRVTSVEAAEIAKDVELRRLNGSVESIRDEQRDFFKWVYERSGDPKRARELTAGP